MQPPFFKKIGGTVVPPSDFQSVTTKNKCNMKNMNELHSCARAGTHAGVHTHALEPGLFDVIASSIEVECLVDSETYRLHLTSGLGAAV